jgi:hypothetical protein
MGQGLPPEVPWVVFPYALYLSESDVEGIMNPKKDEIVETLTSWSPEGSYSAGEIINRDPVSVSGNSSEDLWQKIQLLYLRRNWGDGWPVTPPTKEQIDWILTGVENDRDERVGGSHGKVVPKGGILTFEVLATCMAMAGGRPEYMPVAVAVCESIIASESTWLSSSMSAYPVQIVNGPIARQIRLSSGFGLFGPDPNRPAGRAIARALWFVHMGCGGLVSGAGRIAQYAEMMPGLVFAEDEENIPQGWKAYCEEYSNFSRGTNCVSYGISFGGGARGFTHRGRGNEPSFEIEMSESFDRAVSVMLDLPSSGAPADTAGSNGVLCYPGSVCNAMASIGWTKESIREELANRLFYLKERVKGISGIERYLSDRGIQWEALSDRFYLYTDPLRIRLMVCGGNHPSRAMWLPRVEQLGAVECRLPSNWNDLLLQAEIDLGSAPESD